MTARTLFREADAARAAGDTGARAPYAAGAGGTVPARFRDGGRALRAGAHGGGGRLTGTRRCATWRRSTHRRWRSPRNICAAACWPSGPRRPAGRALPGRLPAPVPGVGARCRRAGDRDRAGAGARRMPGGAGPAGGARAAPPEARLGRPVARGLRPPPLNRSGRQLSISPRAISSKATPRRSPSNHRPSHGPRFLRRPLLRARDRVRLQPGHRTTSSQPPDLGVSRCRLSRSRRGAASAALTCHASDTTGALLAVASGLRAARDAPCDRERPKRSTQSGCLDVA